jgi:hypothetical protein
MERMGSQEASVTRPDATGRLEYAKRLPFGARIDCDLTIRIRNITSSSLPTSAHG